MDRKLLHLLCSPDTRQPLSLLESKGLEALNKAIASGTVQRADGSIQNQSLHEALITRDRKQVFELKTVSPSYCPRKPSLRYRSPTSQINKEPPSRQLKHSHCGWIPLKKPSQLPFIRHPSHSFSLNTSQPTQTPKRERCQAIRY